MTDTDPNVTVVIPAYHAERFIVRAIQSVLDQSGVNPEIIVVVDGLVDRTADIAKNFPKTRVVINEVNQGAPAARNRGLALAQAPYVMFLDADDWIEGPLLQGLVEALDVYQADIAFGPCRTECALGKHQYVTSLCTDKSGRPSKISSRDVIIFFMRGSYIHPCATMWRSDYIYEQGGWNESLVKFQDFEVVHRCLLRGAATALTGKGCGVYYQHISDHRITLNETRASWQSQLKGMSLIVDEAKNSGFLDSSVKEAIVERAKYMLWMFARRADYHSYREARHFFAELGVKRMDGTLAHKIGCIFLGLRRKEQLSRKVAWAKKYIFKRRRFLKLNIGK